MRAGDREMLKQPYEKPKFVLVMSLPLNYSVSGNFPIFPKLFPKGLSKCQKFECERKIVIVFPNEFNLCFPLKKIM